MTNLNPFTTLCFPQLSEPSKIETQVEFWTPEKKKILYTALFITAIAVIALGITAATLTGGTTVSGFATGLLSSAGGIPQAAALTIVTGATLLAVSAYALKKVKQEILKNKNLRLNKLSETFEYFKERLINPLDVAGREITKEDYIKHMEQAIQAVRDEKIENRKVRNLLRDRLLEIIDELERQATLQKNIDHIQVDEQLAPEISTSSTFRQSISARSEYRIDGDGYHYLDDEEIDTNVLQNGYHVAKLFAEAMEDFERVGYKYKFRDSIAKLEEIDRVSTKLDQDYLTYIEGNSAIRVN